MIHKKQADKTMEYIQLGIDEGAELVIGGCRADQNDVRYPDVMLST
jgi:acyl-CoA reductase-like NAD-dependent aldehyde dehydrogenase